MNILYYTRKIIFIKRKNEFYFKYFQKQIENAYLNTTDNFTQSNFSFDAFKIPETW